MHTCKCTNTQTQIYEITMIQEKGSIFSDLKTWCLLGDHVSFAIFSNLLRMSVTDIT